MNTFTILKIQGKQFEFLEFLYAFLDFSVGCNILYIYTRNPALRASKRARLVATVRTVNDVLSPSTPF